MELRILCSVGRKRPNRPNPTIFNRLHRRPRKNPIGRLNVDSNIQTISPFVFNVSSHSPTYTRIRSSILRIGQVCSLLPRRHPWPLKVKSKPTAPPSRTPPALPLSQARPPPPRTAQRPAPEPRARRLPGSAPVIHRLATRNLRSYPQPIAVKQLIPTHEITPASRPCVTTPQPRPPKAPSRTRGIHWKDSLAKQRATRRAPRYRRTWRSQAPYRLAPRKLNHLRHPLASFRQLPLPSPLPTRRQRPPVSHENHRTAPEAATLEPWRPAALAHQPPARHTAHEDHSNCRQPAFRTPPELGVFTGNRFSLYRATLHSPYTFGGWRNRLETSNIWES